GRIPGRGKARAAPGRGAGGGTRRRAYPPRDRGGGPRSGRKPCRADRAREPRGRELGRLAAPVRDRAAEGKHGLRITARALSLEPADALGRARAGAGAGRRLRRRMVVARRTDPAPPRRLPRLLTAFRLRGPGRAGRGRLAGRG